MSYDQKKKIEERANQVRRQESSAHDPASPDPEAADIVNANRAMKAEIAGEDGARDAELAAEEAAAGYRMNSTDRPKHAAREGKDPSLPDRGRSRTDEDPEL